MSIAYISENISKKYNLQDGQVITLRSGCGEINVKIIITNRVLDSYIHMEVGWWEKSSNPNFLIENNVSDMGGQVAYNDTFVEIKK
ncbi:molybdopterin dinucleotide binding domain-containing protein [Clostridium thailandense]|uniref:molybdopterin dinucleotide binding domain-containing protein n=1 Tax=Clostridium thailandense TaxID=2794346 RepID=UPI0035E448D6